MPPTTENIPEQPTFDVYAMLLVLTFVFTAGASFLLRDELVKQYGFGSEPNAQRAEQITTINEEPGNQKFFEIANMRKEDRAEWELVAGKGKPFPVSNYEWPAGYNPLQHPVQANQDNLQAIPQDQLKALLSRTPTPLEAPSAPAPETPAAPATPEAPAAAPAAAPAEPAAPVTPPAN